MKIKFLQKKKKFKKGGSGIKPDFYWRFLIYISFILISASCIFAVFLFKKVNMNSVLNDLNLKEQETIKKERIDKVLEYFEERRNKSIEILNFPLFITDPSL